MSSSTQDTGSSSDEHNETTLISAAAEGLADKVQQLIAVKANLELQDDWGMTALSHAVENDHPHIVKLLADANVVLEYTDGNNVPLICAAERGLLQIVEVLLAAKANVDIEDANGHSALWHAQNNGHEAIVEALLAANATYSGFVPPSQPPTTNTADAPVPLSDHTGDGGVITQAEINLRAARSALLYDAASENNVVVLDTLLSTNASLDWRNADGRTPLIQAVIDKNTAAVLLMLEHRACVDVSDNENRTALIHAAVNGDTDMLTTLIQARATIDHEDVNNMTALRYALRDVDAGHAQLLVDANAAIDTQSNQMLTQSNELLNAAKTGDVALTHTLLAARVSPDVKRNGESVLSIALAHEHMDVISALIEARATIDPQQSCWNAVLTNAVCKEDYGTVQSLLDAKVSPDATAGSKNSKSLIYAIEYGSFAAVPLLLAAKAALDLADSYWTKALIKVALCNHVSALQSLLNAGISPNVSADNETALVRAAKQDKFESVHALVDAKAAFDPTDNDWQQVLIRAAGGNGYDAVKSLIHANVSFSAVNRANETALMCAVAEEQSPTVQLLIDSKAVVDTTNPVWQQVMIRVIGKGKLKAVECMLNLSVSPNVDEDNTTTPLMHAIGMNQFDILQILLDAGARIEPENRAWAAIWRKVAGSGTDWDQIEVRRYRRYADVPADRNFPSNSGLEDAKRMLDLRVSPNIEDEKGCTPLMYAVKENNFALVRLLVDANATVNPRQDWWTEALFRNVKRFRHMYISDEISSEICGNVQFLLDTKALPDVIDSDGRTPLMYASMMRTDSISRLLLAAAAEQRDEQLDMLQK